MPDIKDIDKPFHIVTQDGGFHSGALDQESAETRAKSLNDQAAKLEIKSRYSVKAN